MNFKMIIDLVKTVLQTYSNTLMLGVIKEGLILAVIGLSVSMLARRITRIFKRNNDIQNDDKFFITIKLFGFILLFVGTLVIIFKVNNF